MGEKGIVSCSTLDNRFDNTVGWATIREAVQLTEEQMAEQKQNYCEKLD